MLTIEKSYHSVHSNYELAYRLQWAPSLMWELFMHLNWMFALFLKNKNIAQFYSPKTSLYLQTTKKCKNVGLFLHPRNNCLWFKIARGAWKMLQYFVAIFCHKELQFSFKKLSFIIMRMDALQCRGISNISSGYFLSFMFVHKNTADDTFA